MHVWLSPARDWRAVACRWDSQRLPRTSQSEAHIQTASRCWSARRSTGSTAEGRNVSPAPSSNVAKAASLNISRPTAHGTRRGRLQLSGHPECCPCRPTPDAVGKMKKDSGSAEDSFRQRRSTFQTRGSTPELPNWVGPRQLML
ncbi:uncharacterized protein N7458_003637 [Penicillium daleae]|uniref:Uncharacterized protein n=1 Tax=Penicillium daleae TaxID=63821 RepID=A0AAD6G7Y2_9EURO|nr:uncharacterized protein N7458_003637 [Penicillium daleae]KAJ5462085.1 hypothetical protein N7458_003637 [Penicillium daleae]